VPHFSLLLREVRAVPNIAPESPNGSLITDTNSTITLVSAVPNNLKRYYGAGDLHFITCSCYRRQPWLASASMRDLLLTVLEEVRQRALSWFLDWVIIDVRCAFRVPVLAKTREMGHPNSVRETARYSQPLAGGL
jgi:hypothetical protein